MPTDLSTLVKSVFKDKRNYQDFDDNEKEQLFFIFNRYASRNHPENANYFNKKGIDKAVALDIWFDFFRDTIYIPSWFYPPRQEKKTKDPLDTILDSVQELDEHDKMVVKKYFKELLLELGEKQKDQQEDYKTYNIKGKKKRGL